MKMLVVFSLFLCIAGCLGSVDVMLKNLTVQRGEDAIIPCTYQVEDISGPPYKITWSAISSSGVEQRLYIRFFDDSNGISVKDPGVDRELDVDEDGTLTLPDVQLEDNPPLAQLKCEVDFQQPGAAIGFMTFEVVVLPVEEPQTDPNQPSYDPSETPIPIGICTSGSGFPTPRISFFKNGQLLKQNSRGGNDGGLIGEIAPDGGDDELSQDFRVEPSPSNDGTSYIVATLHTTVSVDDDKAVFSCKVFSGKGEEAMEQSRDFAEFRVNHETTQVSIAASSPHAFQGELYQLTCLANGYPEPSMTFDGNNSPTLDLTLDYADKDREVICEAGGITRTFIINLLYAMDPTIEGTAGVELGESVELQCGTDSNPAANGITWKKDQEEIANAGGDDLQLTNVSFDNMGTYTCTAQNRYPNLMRNSAAHVLSVNGIIFDTETQTVVGGLTETVTLECTATSYPTPTIVWMTHDNKTVDGNFMDNESPVYTSTLDVGPLDSSMSKGKIQCIVSIDADGMKSSKTKTFILPELLKESGVSAAAIIIVILILLLLVAVVLAVLYNKGYICKNKEDGSKKAKDISVQMTEKDPEKGAAVEQTGEETNAQKEQSNQKEEEKEKLMQENGDKN